jgi:hypothetical protein
MAMNVAGDIHTPLSLSAASARSTTSSGVRPGFATASGLVLNTRRAGIEVSMADEDGMTSTRCTWSQRLTH